MKIKSKALTRFGGLVLAAMTRGWMSTLDSQAVFYDPRLDPASSDFAGPCIYILWHEYILYPFYLRGHCQITMLLSQHQDAEWLSEAARYMGFQTVRGSTNRGGVAAIRKLIEQSRLMNLAITPDGPRGPRRQLAPGAIFLASRLAIPLVPLGFGYERPWRVRRAWDQFAIPRPYSRARAIIGPAIWVPPGIERDGLEQQRVQVESVLETITQAAEAWAAGGHRLENQGPIVPKAAPHDRQVVRAA